MPIPLEEIEAQIRSTSRTCKGPCVLSAKEQQELRSLWYIIQDAGNLPAALAMIEGLEFALKTGHLPMSDPSWELLFRRCADLIYLHQGGCNYDFNNIILANALDGADHSEITDDSGNLIADNRVTCPNCGVKVSYKAPNYTEV